MSSSYALTDRWESLCRTQVIRLANPSLQHDRFARTLLVHRLHCHGVLYRGQDVQCGYSTHPDRLVTLTSPANRPSPILVSRAGETELGCSSLRDLHDYQAHLEAYPVGDAQLCAGILDASSRPTVRLVCRK